MTGEHQKNDWFAVGAYALLAGVSQLLWLTYAPITTQSAAHFGVSEDAVGWLAEIFPLLYVVFAIPAAMLLDRWMRQTLIAAGALMLGGATLRVAIDSYGAALSGQFLVALAQPAVLAAVTKLAAERVAPGARPLAISLGSAGLFAGIVLALVLGATIGARDELRPLLWINFAAALLAAVLVLVALRRPSETEDAESVAIGFSDLRAIYTDAIQSRLGAMMFIGMGVFNALATWLEVLLRPDGVSSSESSWILVAMTLAGIAGAITLPPLVARGRRERWYLQLAAFVGAGCLVATQLSGEVFWLVLVAAGAGFVLLAAQPVILEISERRAGRTAASAAGAIFLAGNLGGILLAVVVQSINSHTAASFFVLAAAMLAIAPIARSLPAGFNDPKT
ncbi:MAG: MFS transporter [Solirubrobacterales bacterium]